MRLKGTAGGAALALLVAACGGGAAKHETSAKPAASSVLKISTTKSAAGTYLTDGSGRSLYLWVADRGGKSVCTGDCAHDWPPLTTKGMPAAGGGVTAGELGSVARPGGGTQVTYKGHPLYYYAGDSGPGTTTGQGSDEFGAKWWLVAPTGAAVTSGNASSGKGGAW